MKKAILALLLVAAGLSAEAQKKCACVVGEKNNKTHIHAQQSKKSVNEVGAAGHFGQNYKVCQTFCGYKICGELATVNNTAPQSCAKKLQYERRDEVAGYGNRNTDDDYQSVGQNNNTQGQEAPAYQSYPFKGTGGAR